MTTAGNCEKGLFIIEFYFQSHLEHSNAQETFHIVCFIQYTIFQYFLKPRFHIRTRQSWQSEEQPHVARWWANISREQRGYLKGIY